MNYQERTSYTNLLLVQGAYYAILGLALLLMYRFPIFFLGSEATEAVYISKLVGGIVMTLGISLLLSSTNFKENRVVFVIGLFSSFCFLVHHSIYSYHYESNIYMKADLILQLGFVVAWTYLSYWKWIEDKFSDL